MATSPGPKAKAAVFVVFIIILVLFVAAVIGINFLSNPWYALVHIAFYVVVVTLVAFQLRDCLRLAKSPAHVSKLKFIALWLALTVLAVVTHLADMLRSDNRDYVRVATDLGVYLALSWSLELVKLLLREAPSAVSRAAASSARAEPGVVRG